MRRTGSDIGIGNLSLNGMRGRNLPQSCIGSSFQRFETNLKELRDESNKSLNKTKKMPMGARLSYAQIQCAATGGARRRVIRF
jgi:hypothetical protein